mmetsp:Transcript_24442/g.52004  ORF Transcript_24442/g.52004 Transcript_24442/m.52004 type:complete len:298 (-) Transcript_24442:217-1110(-)
MIRKMNLIDSVARPTILLLLLLCSNRTCHCFQNPSPLLLSARLSALSTSTPTLTTNGPSPTSSSSNNNKRRYSAHTRFYADPSSPNIHDQTPPPPSFEQRMREQLKRRQSNQRSQSAANSVKTESPASNKNKKLVSDVRQLQEFKEVLDQAGEDDQMLAVLWYSPWCKACKAVLPGIRTLAKRHPGVRFIQVPVLEENANLHQGLDVPSVPFLHLYAPEDPRLVEEKKMTRKRLSAFQKLLCDYERGHCSLEQMVLGDDTNDEGIGVWSTSTPYSFPCRTSSTTAAARSAASATNSP